jgi:hypothetical protein
MPGAEEREKIWRSQIHARKKPLADDVDFRALAERYPGSGGDIKNAVLKAAQAAVAEPGDDAEKRITQNHFAQAMEEVLAAKRVMDQSLFGNLPMPWNDAVPPAAAGDEVRDEISTLAARVVEVEDTLVGFPDALQRMEAGRTELQRRVEQLVASAEQEREGARAVIAQHQAAWERRLNLVLAAAGAAIVLALIAIVLVLLR